MNDIDRSSGPWDLFGLQIHVLQVTVLASLWRNIWCLLALGSSSENICQGLTPIMFNAFKP